MNKRPDTSNLIDEEYLRKTILFKRLQRKNKSFIDMEIEDIQGIIEELLLELISNEHITSMNTVIPFIDKEHPLKVTIGLFTDEGYLMDTFKCTSGKEPLFISKSDIVDMMVNILKKENGNPMYHELSYYFHYLAHDLGVIDTFKQRVR